MEVKKVSYVTSIKTAIFIFPIVAFLFTIPFILHQYHKYGSIHKLRVFIIYSFILYMMCIYFLVILPLPKMSEVTASYKDMMQLTPFAFIRDFFHETSLVITNPKTYLTALKEPCVYVVVFNIVMTIPFGMYLRYYFKYDLKKVLIASFLLSLFFELTQLSGLYFIYKGPYRLFDVDDIILNTSGGVLGFLLFGLLKNLLPTREKIDEDSYTNGRVVSGLRRMTIFGLDTFLYILIYILIFIFIRIKHLGVILFFIYFGLIPLILCGKTLGSKFLNVVVEVPNQLFLRMIFKNIFLYFYYFVLPFLFMWVSLYGMNLFDFRTHGKIIFLIILLIFLLLFYIIHFLILFIKGKIYYDKIFKISYKSTISKEE